MVMFTLERAVQATLLIFVFFKKKVCETSLSIGVKKACLSNEILRMGALKCLRT